MLQQHLENLHVAAACRQMNSNLAIAIRNFLVGAGIEQDLCHRSASSQNGVVQRRRACFQVPRIHIGAMSEQESHHLDITRPGRIVKRRASQRIPCIRADAAIQ